MENSYGIGIANRYELFYVDEEAGDAVSKGLSKKAKQQKKIAPTVAIAANVSATKEIKSVTSNKTSNGVTAVNVKITKGGNDNQNARNNLERTTRDGKENVNKPLTKNAPKNGLNGENKEQRYNRKPRENQPLAANGQDITANQNGINGRGNDDRSIRRQGGNSGLNNDRSYANRRNGAGKREFDRQSGSDKTGVKAIDKRDGGGAHNWGSIKQEIDDSNKAPDADWHADQGKDSNKNLNTSDSNENEQQNNKEQAADQVNNNQTEEDETKEFTLDEWKALKAIRIKPKYNIRKAGEGEDTTKWKKMVALESRKKKEDENSEDELEYDASKFLQRVGRQKHVLDIDFRFSDGPRASRRKGRERSQRTWQGNQPRGNGTSAERKNGNFNVDNAGRNGNEHRRPQQNNRNKSHFNRTQNTPKVYDEHDFPSLG